MIRLSDDEKTAIRTRKWVLPCPEMTLDFGDRARSISGHGELTNAPSGDLEGVMFVDTRQAPELEGGHMRDLPSVCNVSACDLQGRTWEARAAWLRGTQLQRTSPYCQLCFSMAELICSGSTVVKSPDVEGRVGGSSSATFVFEHQICFPTNDHITHEHTENGQPARGKVEPVANVRVGALDITLRNHDKTWVCMCVNADLPAFPDMTEERLLEALQFVLAQPCHCLIVTRREEAGRIVKVRSRQGLRHDPQIWRMFPPVDCRRENAQWTWALFEAYFACIQQLRSTGEHPLSSHMSAVLNAMYGAPACGMLTLAVAVEGILNHVFPSDLAVPEPLAKALEETRDFLVTAWDRKELTISQRHRKIICSTLKSLARPGEPDQKAADRLRVLVAQSVIDEADVDAWRRYRLPLAHGRPPSRDASREYPPSSERVLNLLYRLILNHIGYKGKYSLWTDFGHLVDFEAVPLGQDP